MFIFSFLGGIFGKFKWQIITILLVGAILGLAYYYWNYSQEKIEELNKQNAILESVINTQNETIKKLQDNVKHIQENLDTLNKKYVDIHNETEKLKKDIKIPTVTKTNKKELEQKINVDINKLFSDINTITNQ